MDSARTFKVLQGICNDYNKDINLVKCQSVESLPLRVKKKNLFQLPASQGE